VANTYDPSQNRKLYEDTTAAFLDAAERAGVDVGTPEGQEDVRSKLRDYFTQNTDALGWGDGDREAFLVHYGLAEPAGAERTMHTVSSLVDIAQNPGGYDQIAAMLESDVVDNRQLVEMAKAAGREIGPLGSLIAPAAAIKAFMLTTPHFGHVVPGIADSPQIPNPFFSQDAAAEAQRLRTLYGRTAIDPFTLKMITDEAAGVQTYQHPIASKLEQAGVPGWLADFAAYDLADPLWLVGGKPLLVAGSLGAAGLGALAVKNRGAVGSLLKTALHVRNAKSLMSEAEISEASRAVREGLEKTLGLGEAAPKAPKVEAILKRAQQLETTQAPNAERLRKLASAMAKGKSKVAELDKALVDQLAKADPADRRAYLNMRLAAVTNQDELAKLQAMYGSRFDLPKSWFSKRQLKDEYFDRQSGKSVLVDGGLVSEYLRHPDRFVENGHWRKDSPRAMALMRQVGAKGRSDVSGVQHLAGLVYVGRSPIIRDVRRAHELAYNEIGRKELTKFFGRDELFFIRPHRYLLQNTGTFEPFVKAREMAYVSHEMRMAELASALGGGVARVDVGLLGQVQHSGLPMKVTSMTDRPTRWKVWSSPDAAMRTENDEIYFMLGKDSDRVAMNAARQTEGLPNIRKISAGSFAKAQRVRLLLDDLHGEAVRAGILTPDQYLLQYIPRLRKELASGKSMTEAIANLQTDYRQRGVMGAEPFFAMVRTGELNPTEFNVAKLVDAYTRMLYRHKYVKPVSEQIIRTLTDPGTTAGGGIDRAVGMDWLVMQLGGRSALQTSALASIKKSEVVSRAMGEGLIDELGSIMSNPAEFDSKARFLSRAFTGAWYTSVFGGRGGPAVRNLSQQLLAVDRLGAGLPKLTRRPYLAMSVKDVATNREFQERFAVSNRSYGWSKNWGEFLDRVEADRRWTALPVKARDALTWHYRVSDLMNRMNVYRATELYAEDLFADMTRGGKAWEVAARKLLTSESATFRNAMVNRDLMGARRILAEATVNDTQWLYHPANRPKLASESSSSLVQVAVDASYLFMSFPINFAESVVHSANTAATADGKFLRGAQRVKGAASWIAALSAFGVALDIGEGIVPGGLDFSRWTQSEWPTGIREMMGKEPGERVAGLKRMPVGLQPLSELGEPISIRGVKAIGGAVEQAFTGAGDPEGLTLMERVWDERYPTRGMLDEFFSATPSRLLAATPFAQELAKSLGFEENDPEYQGVVERIVKAWVDEPKEGSARAEEGFGKRTLRAQGIPFEKEIEQ